LAGSQPASGRQPVSSADVQNAAARLDQIMLRLGQGAGQRELRPLIAALSTAATQP
jgi:hypothetical protein